MMGHHRCDTFVKKTLMPQAETIVSLVIPVYRNEFSLKITYDKVLDVFRNELPLYSPEFIFINDGSDDGSLNELLALKKNDPSIRIISLSRNFGQVAAVIAGFKKVTGKMAILLSADLQDPPELITRMIESSEAGNKIVICHRINRNDSLFSSLASSIFYRLIHYSNPRIPKDGFDFVLMNRQVVDVFNSLDERNRFFQGDILWLGFPVQYLPYSRLKRVIGKSQWSISKKIKYFIDGLVNTSYIPIRLMSIAGFAFTLVGFIYAFVIVYLRLINKIPINGNSVIITLILMMGGLIMLMMGIIGEYLWRTYDETRKRPLYIIEEEFD
jgi:dolichol-phosphate mannosyltransferase